MTGWQLTMSARILVRMILAGVSLSASETYHYQAPVSLLHELVIGQVVTCCGPRYEALRTVNNRACISRVSSNLDGKV